MAVLTSFQPSSRIWIKHPSRETAITSLSRLTHRGAIAADGKTGDGCGLLLKKPDGFLRAAADGAGLRLADVYAAGLVGSGHSAARIGRFHAGASGVTVL